MKPPKKKVIQPRQGSSKRTATVDVAKAKSLREAGWTWSKIGEEFRVSAQAVQSAVARAKKLELTAEERAGCEKLAEELMGGNNDVCKTASRGNRRGDEAE